MGSPFSLIFIGDESMTEMRKAGLNLLNDPEFEIKIKFSRSAKEALSGLESGDYDLIVADYKSTDLSGTGLIRKIREKNRVARLLIVADPADKKMVLEDLQKGYEFGLIFSGDDDRILTRIKNIIEDVQYQKNPQKEIGESKHIIRAILDSTDNIGIITTDINNIITFFSRGAEKLLDYSHEEVVGKATPMIFHVEEEISERADELFEKTGKKIEGLDLFDEIIAGGKPERREWTYKKKDGGLIVVDLTMTRIKDASGNIWGSFGMFYDITGRKELEEEFRLYKIQSSGIISNIPEPTFAIDLDGRVIAWNRAIEDLTGIPAQDILGKGDHEYALPFYGKRRPMLIDLITAPEELMKKWEYEDITRIGNVIAADVAPFNIRGKTFYFRVSASPIYDKNSKTIGAVECASDFTHIKEVEEALAREKANVEYIIDSLPGMFYMFYMFDENGRFVRWNKNLETITGYSAEEVRKMKPLEFIGDDYKVQSSESIKAAFTKGYSDLEAIIVTKDGRKIPFFFSANREVINGTPYILGMGLDITKAKEKDEEIRKLASVVRHSGEMIALADPKGVINFINEAGAKMVGVCVDEIEGYLLTDFIPDSRKEIVSSEIMPALAEKGLWEGELEYINKRTGDTIDVHAMVFTINDPETGEPVHLANMSLNITDKKKAKAALREVNKKLNLLGSITRHDILNQITVAQGYMDILEMDGQIAKETEVGDKCERVAGAIETIKRLILFTKDYKDLGEQSPEWYNVGRIIDSNYRNSGFQSIRLVNETDDLEVYADPLFGKVIYNLFDNAVKHGEKITTIKFYFTRSEDGLDLVCEDDGVGVPGEFKEKIFRREHYQNTGLGLFLSGEILSITGMSIEENGRYGEGARFVIHIPKGLFRFPEKPN